VPQFQAIDDEYLRERSTDVRQVSSASWPAGRGRPTRMALPRKIARANG